MEMELKCELVDALLRKVKLMQWKWQELCKWYKFENYYVCLLGIHAEPNLPSNHHDNWLERNSNQPSLVRVQILKALYTSRHWYLLVYCTTSSNVLRAKHYITDLRFYFLAENKAFFPTNIFLRSSGER